ncbi:MAG: 30S ribosomal protein S12 methylthiotransferase RimO [Candidatus Edwardsbacteria bacterium]
MKIYFISLGCPKNLVDSEGILGTLERMGHRIVDEAEQADTIIINTCAFIKEAKQESIEKILEAIEVKKKNRSKLLVIGCLSQRYKDSLITEIPEVDAFLKLDDYPKLFKILRSSCKIDCSKLRFHSENLYSSRKLLTPSHTAYLKIADGCNNHCSYCTIPLIRGPYHSRPLEKILKEAEILAEKGVKEINLLAQDTTLYGIDLSRKPKLATLLGKLSTIQEIKWLRLLYTHPAHWTDELLEFISSNRKICKYLDIPIQHICDDILRAMNRGVGEKEIRNLISSVRKNIPGVTLRTSIIVGFPGETERHFRKLLDFVEEMEFERLGAFIYSKEEGTEAFSLPNQVPEREKKKRYERIMEAQQKIVRKKNKSMIGRTLKVLLDTEIRGGRFTSLDIEKTSRVKHQYLTGLIGRTEGDALEIDQLVWVHSARKSSSFPTLRSGLSNEVKGNRSRVGDFVKVKITEAKEYDLIGEIV